MLVALTRSMLLLLLALAPVAAWSQTESAAPPPGDTLDARQREIRQITARLTQLQQQASQDPAVKAAQDSLNALVQGTMARLDPSYTTLAQRAQALPADVAAAQAASDNARLHELAEEAKQLQQSIASVQARAMQDAAVREQVGAYRVKLFTRMVEIDPEAQKLADRLGELQRAPGSPPG